MVVLVLLTYIIVAILIWYCIYIYRIKCYKKRPYRYCSFKTDYDMSEKSETDVLVSVTWLLSIPFLLIFLIFTRINKAIRNYYNV